MARVLKEYPSIVLKPEKIQGFIDFDNVFGRPGELHIEIGSGKGAFLFSQGSALPQINLLGIEWAAKYYRYAMDRIGRRGLENVRLIRTDAAEFIAQHIPDQSVQCFHIYFPDPWPKKRHHKRRFICDENSRQLIRCLKPLGHIRIATDHAGYFEQICSVVAQLDAYLEPIDFVPAPGTKPGEWTGTNYERKYIKDQRHIHTLALRRK